MDFKSLKHSEFESKGDTIKPLSDLENRGHREPQDLIKAWPEVSSTD